MFHKENSVIEIKDGAFLVSDAHYSSKRPQLLDFFKDIYNKKLQPTQLILMGDIFDLLIGGVEKSIQNNQEIVDMLNKISKDIDVIYLEGNHDFNLKKVFPNSKVFKLSNQPLKCQLNSKIIYIAHGDFNVGYGYRIYTSLIRNSFIMAFLNFINKIFNNIILNKLDIYLDKKDDCKEIGGFESIVYRRLNNMPACDYIVEGHFHQNKFIKFNEFRYLNLAAFACNQRYFVVKSLQEELFVCKEFHKGT